MMTGHAGACTLHADSPREALERLSTLLGSEKGVSPRDAARMIASSAWTCWCRSTSCDEVRRVTSIARVDKQLKNGEAWFTPLWRYDETSSAEEPRWLKVENKP